MYRYAIIGLGGLGKLHLANLIKIGQKRGDIALCAVCGIGSADELKSAVKINLGAVDISEVDFSGCNFYTDYRELLDRERPHFILSTLPTHLHEEVALYALSRGAHVFSEKPMALNIAACERMIAARNISGKKLMIGHCLRFDPMLTRLKEYIDGGELGRVYRAEFIRYSQLPRWTWNNWILDPEQSGGCVLDMHIHDVDLINWFFGMPRSVSAAVTSTRAELESIFTQYRYDGLLVTANADWSMPQSFPFTARILMNFERATVLAEGNRLHIYRDDREYIEEFAENTAFYEEISAFLALALDGRECRITSPESILKSVYIALCEVEAAKTGRSVSIQASDFKM